MTEETPDEIKVKHVILNGDGTAYEPTVHDFRELNVTKTTLALTDRNDRVQYWTATHYVA